MAQPPATYSTLREAYVARHRIPADRFEGHAFRSTLFRHALLAAPFSRLADPQIFRQDYEALRAVGASACANDFSRALDALGNMLFVERSLQRRFFGIRISLERVVGRFEPLLPLLKPIEEAVEAPPARRAGRPSPSIEVREQAVHRLKKVHTAVVHGVPPDRAIAEAGYLPGEFPTRLAELKGGRPDLEWLHGYLSHLDASGRLAGDSDSRPALR